MSFPPSIDRASLRALDLVLAKNGLQPESVDVARALYRSSRGPMAAALSIARGEVGLDFDVEVEGRMEQFSWGEVAPVLLPPVAILAYPLYASNQEELDFCVGEYARQLDAVGGPFLRMEVNILARVRDAVSERRNRDTAGAASGPAVKRADAAWIAGDYAAVVGALEPVENYLTDRDRRRLDFARAKLGRHS
jgi:hypothetical protein